MSATTTFCGVRWVHGWVDDSTFAVRVHPDDVDACGGEGGEYVGPRWPSTEDVRSWSGTDKATPVRLLDAGTGGGWEAVYAIG